ncbi:MAG: type II secretion system F family protein [Stappiaceae bacterium]
MSLSLNYLASQEFLVSLLTVIAVSATFFTVIMPFFEKDTLKARMKSVATERDKIRERERANMSSVIAKPSLRQEPKKNIRDLVDKFNLRNVLADENSVMKLRMAGLRGQKPLYMFVAARVLIPTILFSIVMFYMFAILPGDRPAMLKIGVATLAALIGLYLPNVMLTNIIQKRQKSIQAAWPDALDLSLICVESGMSVEASFRKVAEEIGAQSVPLAEELSLTTAELSYLPERKQAFENLATRTGLDTVKAMTTALIQAERYGTPLGVSFRVMAEESRTMRMQAAEKKAASLPPKLTVPMIVFFLPVLFAVIMGPAIMSINKI